MESLENQLLIAMPSLNDGYFNKTVTYICEHNEDGAMGLIINLPVNITLYDLLKQIEDNEPQVNKEAKKTDLTETPQNKESDTLSTGNKNTSENIEEISENLADKLLSSTIDIKLEQLVLSGGPIAQQRGFVLHSTQKGWSSSLALSENIMITTSKDILMALGTDDAPEQFMVTLGYAGWGPGQLEEEIKANSWLTAPADKDILFNTPIELRWKKATEKLGIDIAHLSSEIGHA